MSYKRKDSPLRILLVADRTLIRLGIRTLLKGHFKIDRIEEVTAEDAPQAISRSHPQIVVYDLDDSEGDVELLRSLGQAPKPFGLVVLTGQEDSHLIRAAYSAGASAVVLKQLRVETLVAAIQKVLAGEVWMDRAVLDTVLDHASKHEAPVKKPTFQVGILTKRENDVVRAIAKGYRNKRIAQELGISEVTVRHHLTAIFGKLQVSDRLGLLIYAHHHGLADISAPSVSLGSPS